MKTLTQKVNEVNKVYRRLDKEIDTFQKNSGLSCLNGCGECCKKPDIEATPIEFLPLALQYYDEGIAEKMYEELQDRTDSLCHIFRPYVTNFGGMCSRYPNRGLICRLFGYSARKNKEGKPELVTCKLIKAGQSEAFEKAVEDLKSGLKVPVMSDYYTRMTSIDTSLAEFYPINKAAQKAIEVVLHYYSYRKRRVSRRNKIE